SPWILVCTMLAVWIGTGSIVGNAEQTYHTGAAALIIPLGTFLGLILLSLIAYKARSIEVSTVPEIIGGRYGQAARFLAVLALVIAYMVIVSYQFNAGGAVLEVITGDRDPVPLQASDVVTRRQLTKGRVVFTPDPDYIGQASIEMIPSEAASTSPGPVRYVVEVVPSDSIVETQRKLAEQANHVAIKRNNVARLRVALPSQKVGAYRLSSLPDTGKLELVEPRLTKEKATIIAAVFIVGYTMSAGLMSLAYADIVTGSIITLSLFVAFPVLLFKAGGFEGMRTAFAAMGDRQQHMQFWGVYSHVEIINYLLPTFLLVTGDANQYQRIFASRNARGAKQAVTTMVFAALVIEMLIIACAWVAASMTPDPENGKYILIYAARHYMPLALGIVFMVTVVGIITSTANSFLLVPATTFIKDVYLNYINPKASEKRTLFLSRLLVVVFGVIAYLVTFAFAESTGFFKKALYAYTIYGSAITPSLVAAMFWKRATKAGAIASILTGTAVTLIWSEVVVDYVPAYLAGLDAVLPAITLSVLALVGVSLLTGKKS
ncbi:MAG: sodium:solute symporter family protein, partial [Sedimentisphaerales bacterium]|nr:sodium:solute symporter family protein [Sedimentisphaerales bacterium]